MSKGPIILIDCDCELGLDRSIYHCKHANRVTRGDVSFISNRYIAQETSVTPASSRNKLSSNGSYMIPSLAAKSIHSMYVASEEMVEEDIVVPMALLASAEPWDHGAPHKACNSYQPEELHVPKRRQTGQENVKARSSREFKESRATHASFLEPIYENWLSNAVKEVAHGVQPGAVTEPQRFFSNRSTSAMSEFTNTNLPWSSHQPRTLAHTWRNSISKSLYDKSKLVKIKHRRKFWLRLSIEYGIYLVLAAFVYLVLIGDPLWKGAICWLYWIMQEDLVFSGGWAIAVAFILLYSFTPLLVTFEKDAPRPEFYQKRHITPATTDAALLIPCYRSGAIIGQTLQAALKIFPASHIYVVANGNSSVPLDDTADICRAYGANHIWCPVGSKIIALFVGCYAVKHFRHVLLIDDDCVLPPNFPVVTSRVAGRVRCIGYTIKSVSKDLSRGSLCQQAQDLEYKLAGLQRKFAGRFGSATFPHGAVSLWETSFLKDTLHHHPGFSISEDWFLGNSCRRLGGRIGICSAVFVETTTPCSLLIQKGNVCRGGFGETTVLKQRLLRWNFFTVAGLWHNISYIVGSWKLGRWEITTKIFVLQEVYDTLLYLLFPFILPISLLIRPAFCLLMILATSGLYLLNAIIFNEIHLRAKDERVKLYVILYFIPYKALIFITNVVSCYWSLFKYATYFAHRHPKLDEDHKAVGMVLKMEKMKQIYQDSYVGLGRSMTVRKAENSVNMKPFY